MKLKNDRYRKTRGGYSRLLQICCSNCDTKLFNYQKDGPGIIKRLYVDRIHKELNSKILNCSKCKNTIGHLTIYEKENRPAYNIVPRNNNEENYKTRWQIESKKVSYKTLIEKFSEIVKMGLWRNT